MVSIFSRIIAGEIPCNKVYEDGKVFAFHDNFPLRLGHILLVPKEEIGNVLDLSDELMTHLILTAKNIIAPAIKRATGCTRVGFAVEGFGVPDHFHLHLIPLFKPGDMNSGHASAESEEAMKSISEKIRTEIQ